MKIVVFGPAKRTGALVDGNVIDLSHATAKYLREKTNDSNPKEMAEALVSSDYAPVQGFVLLMASVFVIVNLFVDVLYGIADPRATVA